MLAVRITIVAALLAIATPSATAQTCTTPDCEGPDLNDDCLVDLSDLSTLLANFGQTGANAEPGDTDNDQDVDLTDLSTLLSAFGRDCGPIVDPNDPNDVGEPNEPDNSTADLTAYRPQFGSGYFPQPRRAVAEADEQDPQLGPGIRRNGASDSDPSGEDDLIEVTVTINPADTPMQLLRSQPDLEVWTTRNRQPGSQVSFSGDRSATLPFGAGATTLTLWIESTAPAHGTTDLSIVRADRTAPKDVLQFHTFQSIVMALGGEGQVPTSPPDPGHGTFLVANDLYALGYDVLQYDEDNVSSNGSGSVYQEIVNAIQQRGVNQVAVFGYSHGGGSVYHLCDRLDLNRGTIGVFELEYTAYVDSVRNNSDVDTASELRRPPSSALHVNHWQNGNLFDFFLDGGPVNNSIPAPSGLNVQTTPWGASSDHFQVDDYIQVRSLMINELAGRVLR